MQRSGESDGETACGVAEWLRCAAAWTMRRTSRSSGSSASRNMSARLTGESERRRGVAARFVCRDGCGCWPYTSWMLSIGNSGGWWLWLIAGVSSGLVVFESRRRGCSGVVALSGEG